MKVFCKGVGTARSHFVLFISPGDKLSSLLNHATILLADFPLKR